jgi:type II secretory pathway pseudopilin PulG
MATVVKVAASSLLEVVVAMVIAVVVFGIGMMTYLNVTRASFGLREFNATLWLQEVAAETVAKRSFFNETFEKENLILHKKVSPYQRMDNLVLMELEVVDLENKRLATQRQLLFTHEDE